MTAIRTPDRWTPRTHVEPADADASVAPWHSLQPAWIRTYERWWPLKRLVDLALLAAIAWLAVPLIAGLSLAVWCCDRGNPFYGQERVGRHGNLFTMWKLRTMRRDADQLLEATLARDPTLAAYWAEHYKLPRDPRILPGIGSVLRCTSLDELPQLWNIARGEMSFVGPRPFPPYHLAAFDRRSRAMRARVTPGMTGLWQVSGRSEEDLNAQAALDVRYVETWSPWRDVGILLRTPWAVISRRGAS